MVGILCTDVSDIYYAKAVSLMENALRPRGYDTLLCCSGNQIEDKRASLRMLLDKRVDAVVLIGSTFQEETDNSHLETAAKQVPVIIINGVVELPGVTCLLCDERSAVASNEMCIRDSLIPIPAKTMVRLPEPRQPRPLELVLGRIL